MFKDTSLFASIKAYVGHKTALDVNESIKKADEVMEAAGVAFAAALSEGQIVGLIRRSSLAGIENTSDSIEYLVSKDALCVSIHESAMEVLDSAMRRSDWTADQDVIVVDDGELLGLVPTHALLKLQHHCLHSEVERLRRLLSSKNEVVNCQENDLDYLNRRFAESQEILTRLRGSRADFIKRYSHEAHTPMNSIIGMLELLSETKLDQDQFEMLNSANASARSLLRLIQSTLDYTQIETKNFESSMESFDPKALLHSVTDGLHSELEQKKLQLICDYDLPEIELKGDVERLQRTVENLLVELLDRTVEGRVFLSATVHRFSTEWHLEINLRSEGAESKIPPSDSGLTGSMAMDVSPDVGPLSIIMTKRVVTQLRGVLTSEVHGNGFGFHLNIPFPLADVSAETPVHSEPAGEGRALDADSGSCQHLLQVLLVDDNSNNLEVARRIFTQFDCSTHLARDGFEALEILKSRNIDCIFLDCEMPGISGHDVCQRVRSGECGVDVADILICAMTAHIMDSSRQMCYEVGMDEFIPKPVSKKAFEAVLAKWEERLRDHCKRRQDEPLAEEA